MRNIWKALLLLTEGQCLSLGNAPVQWWELQARLDLFLMGHHPPWLTEKLFHRSGHLADIFLKMNEMSRSWQGKQLTEFDVNYKIWAFKQKLKFWKPSKHHRGFDSLKTLNEFNGDINKRDILIWYKVKCVNT